MTLRIRFIIAFLLTSGFLVIVGGAGIYSNMQLSRNVSHFLGDAAPALSVLSELSAAGRDVGDSLLYRWESSVEPTKQEEKTLALIQKKDLVRITSNLKSLSVRYMKLARHSPKQHPKASEISSLVRELVELSEEYSDYRKLDPEESLAGRAQAVRDVISRLDKAVDFSIDIVIDSFKHREAEARQVFSRVIIFHYGAIGLSLVLSLTVAVWLASYLSQPILRMQKAAAEFGRGNLKVRVGRVSNDEMGDLSVSLDRMAENLETTTISKDYLDEILASMDSLLFVVNKDGAIEKTNRAVLDVLHYEAEEVLGLRIDAVVRGWEEVTGGSQRARIQAVETSFCASDGREVPVLFSARSFEWSRDSGGYIVVAQDISDKRRVEEERDSYRARLVAMEQLASLGTMSAIVAHKLNQPLTALRLFLQQIKRGVERRDTEEKIKETLSDSLEEVDTACAIIKGVLEYTRNAPGPIQSVKIGAVAEKVIRALEEDARRAQVEIFSEGLVELPSVMAGAGEIDKIFFVLIQNAIYAGKDRAEARISIKGREEDDFICLTFADTCGGIPEENLDKVFELFFTNKPQGEGTGLGLCIVKQIVSRLQGEIWVETNFGEGSTFYVKIPTGSNP